MPLSRLSLAMGLFLAAPLALAASPVGHWTGKIMMNMQSAPSNVTPQQKAAMQQMMAKARIMLDLKANKTFTLSMSGMPNAQGAPTQTGKWSQKGNVVVATQTKPGSMPQNLKLAPNGKTMTLSMPGNMGKVVFTR